MKTLLLSLALFMTQLSAGNVPLEDPRQEARAQRLMREIRCIACDSEPISQSTAPIADDMRGKVREMISQGASDQDVREWFVARYDEYVLFRPPSQGIGGIILWSGPFVLLFGIGGLLIVNRMRESSKKAKAVAPESFDHENGNTP